MAAGGAPRRVGRPLRAGARDGAGHRRQGHRESDRRDPVGGYAPAVLAEYGEGRRPRRGRGAPGARARPPDGGHRRSGSPGNGDAGDGGPDRARSGAAILMAPGLSIAVVGATGAAGRTTLKILEERKFPVRELRAFASERSGGKTVTFRGEPVPIRRIEPGAFKGGDIAFFSAGSAQAKEDGPAICKARAIVIAKANAFRMDPEGPPGEEMKLVNETRKILEAPELRIPPPPVGVAVYTSHSIAVPAETAVKITAARARDLFERFPGLKLWDDPAQHRYPMPIAVEGQDDCFVGRIREDLSSANGLSFWVVGDQLRKGAATNAVQIAELLARS